MKIVFIEPNLKDSFGHGYMVMKSLEKYINKSTKIKHKFYLVSNSNISNLAHNTFKQIYPLATVGNFDSTNPDDVEKYINEIINRFKLSKKDLVVFPTAHVNEILAVTKKLTSENLPHFLLQIHQFYPPLYDSGVIDNKLFRFIKKSFQTALEKIPRDKVVITTTESKLNHLLSSIAGNPIFIMDVPMPSVKTENNLGKIYDFSFLGDGRKEKGLDIFLDAATRIIDEGLNYNFFFQNPNLRCFNDGESIKMREKIKYINDKYSDKIHSIDRKMTLEEYQSFLQKSKCLVLPYDPRHYDKRVSGIAIECGCIGISIITSNKTSMGDKIKSKKQSGITFSYDNRNKDKTISNLVSVMKRYKAKERCYMKLSNSMKKDFVKKSDIEQYINRCLTLTFQNEH